MSRSAIKYGDARGGRPLANAPGVTLGALSVGLSIAAVEFALVGMILVAVAAMGMVSLTSALMWGVVLLVPLSASIAFLGIRLGIVSRRAAPEAVRGVRGKAPQVA